MNDSTARPSTGWRRSPTSNTRPDQGINPGARPVGRKEAIRVVSADIQVDVVAAVSRNPGRSRIDIVRPPSLDPWVKRTPSERAGQRPLDVTCSCTTCWSESGISMQSSSFQSGRSPGTGVPLSPRSSTSTLHVLAACKSWVQRVRDGRGAPCDQRALGFRGDEPRGRGRQLPGWLHTWVEARRPGKIVPIHARDREEEEGHNKERGRGTLRHMVEEELQHRGELNALLWQDDIEPPVTDWFEWKKESGKRRTGREDAG